VDIFCSENRTTRNPICSSIRQQDQLSSHQMHRSNPPIGFRRLIGVQFVDHFVVESFYAYGFNRLSLC